MMKNTLPRLAPLALLFVAPITAAQTTTAWPHDIDVCGVPGGINCLKCHELYVDGGKSLTRFNEQESMCTSCHGSSSEAAFGFTTESAPCVVDDNDPLWKVANHNVTAHLTGLQTDGTYVVTAPNARFIQMGLEQLEGTATLTITSPPNADQSYTIETVVSETELILSGGPAPVASNNASFDVPQIIDCGTCHDPHGRRDADVNLRQVRADSTIYKNLPQLSGGPAPVYPDRTSDDGFVRESATPGIYEGICNVCHTKTSYHRANASGDHTHEIGRGACTVCHPHNRGFKGIGGNCAACHLGDGDVDDYDHSNDVPSVIDRSEWTTVGHGSPTVGLKGEDTCLYCHDEEGAGGSKHDDPINPFRLVNLPHGTCSVTTSAECVVDSDCPGAESCDLPAPVAWQSNTPNDVCLICHDHDGPGYDGGTVANHVNATNKPTAGTFKSRHHATDPPFSNAKHDATHDGGSLCWDCHDPHGDDNIKMIARRPMKDKNDGMGWSGTVVSTDVVFTADQAPGDFGDPTAGSPSKLCNACHSLTSVYAASTATPDHNDGQLCTGCHLHERDAFDAGFYTNSDLKCADCHFNMAQPDSDKDSWNIPANDAAQLSPVEYNSVGHGQLGWTENGCLYCHVDDQGSSPLHKDGGDPGGGPFLLVNTSSGANPNGNCDICHAPGATGYDPFGSAPASYVATNSDISSDHHGSEHAVGRSGGKLCWDCHDPHGDDSDGAGATPGNIKMIGTQLLISGDSWGLVGTRTPLATPIVFTNNTSSGDFASTSATPDRICNVCHAVAGHYKTTSGDGHLMAAMCTDCHPHENTTFGADAFVPIDAPCTNCHTDPTTDVDSWNITDQVVSLIAMNDWTGAGHGQYGWAEYRCSDAATACTYDADCPAGERCVPTPDECLYCHEPDSVVAHGVDTNPFKLANNNAQSGGWNDNCIVCHDGDATGYAYGGDPVQNGTTEMQSHHAPGRPLTGGTFCWDCHDPHGDSVDGTQNIDMIGSALNQSPDQYGLTGARTGTTRFTNDATGADFVTDLGGSEEGVCNVCHTTAGHYTASSSDGHLSTGRCTGCHLHEGAGPDGFSPADVNCRTCHTDPTTDRDSWDIFDGTISLISIGEYTTVGHGRPGVGFDGPNDCLYCHEPDATVPHELPTNPFKLANTTGGWNNNCTVCHDGPGGYNGYGPSGYTPVDGGDTAALGVHNPGGRSPDGGARCWDCHDPHGDASNIMMIGSTLTWSSHDQYGLTGSRTGPTVFVGTANAGDFAKTSGQINGVCNVCHVPENAATHYTAAGSDGTNHESASGGCSTGSCHNHEQTPDNAFNESGGGNCLNCHNTKRGVFRAVWNATDGGDFGLASHHVGTGSAYMGGELTNFDCVVCHAEGEVVLSDPISTGTTGYHMDADCNGDSEGCVDLRDADVPNSVYRYDPTLIKATSTDPADWYSATPVWRAQQATQMDPFCLSCHDADGAAATFSAETGASALNPFADGFISNDYDRQLRYPAAGNGNKGRVIDIASMVVSSGSDLDQASEDRGPDGIPDPPAGIYSRHAIRGQSVSPYVTYSGLGGGMFTMYDYGSFVNPVDATDERGEPIWNDTSLMACADCHTSDGANGSTGNAHGSTSEYLLKDANLTATEGNYASRTYNCYACHDGTVYSDATGHAPNGNDWQHTSASTGTTRVNTGKGGSIYGIACLNCHGGVGWGSIHGTSDEFGVGQSGGSGTRQAYRFTNGGSLRYYDPLGWTGSQAGCYTLGGSDGTWGGCSGHSKGTTRAKVFWRTLSY